MRQRTRRQRGGDLTIQYPSTKVNRRNIAFGAVQSTPTVTLNVNSTVGLYTLIMHDPDAPGHDTANPWLHWLVVNIPGSDFSSGLQLLGYLPPNPPFGKHKYIFSLYKQRFGRITVPTPRPDNFDLAAFVRQNNLIKVGETFMRVARITP